ncbi:NAD-dependent epimerase/dehydratase family protein [Pararhizobium mangrovi]|uniref:NAD-dependent epimerase/dehydratase family protein n=1 Tax=Pararhizobium mangrovi TaxID=2590452 RepID=A0A506U7E8_9HYPH|nr:NAD-dependent epimerase/dehydratase family protein [Pararhizobium mangrovi]
MRFFVTGSAGFIGFHVARRLLDDGHHVTGYDALTPYYDVTLKTARHALLENSRGFKPVVGQLEDMACLEKAMERAAPDVVIHLAAQAGVRYSLENPSAYVSANLTGSFNLLEAARKCGVTHLLLASTSSVYGANDSLPYCEGDHTDHPITLYAATKRGMEAMSHSYAHLWKMPTTILRFFTVYGPWGRPDMALFKFVDAILGDRPIDVYGNGRMRRDFTYVDDLVEAIVRLVPSVPVEGRPAGDATIRDTLSPVAPWRIVNIAGGKPIGLIDFIDATEKALGRKARCNFLAMQKGDMAETAADFQLLRHLTGYVPSTRLERGIEAFVDWHRDYFDHGNAGRSDGDLPAANLPFKPRGSSDSRTLQ